MKPVLKQVNVEHILNLRHQVLRPGRPLSTAKFAGDFLENTMHFAAFQSLANEQRLSDETIVGCVSFIPKYNSNFVQKSATQLRGMAITAEYRGLGIGQQLLRYAENQIKLEAFQLIWCNVRIASITFYLKNGYFQKGNQFNIPNVGLHVLMYKTL